MTYSFEEAGRAYSDAREAASQNVAQLENLLASIANDRDEHDAQIENELSSQRAHLESMLRSWQGVGDSLIFGALELTSGSTIFVGPKGIRNKDGEQIVTDWRAAVARVFYQATVSNPQGVVRRAQVFVDNDSVTLGETEWLRVGEASAQLSTPGGTPARPKRDNGMSSVVETLHAEQDAIIRASASDSLLIDGAPGTGKTVVGLHRLAYLLYENMAMARAGVLTLGPSEAYSTFVRNVLPSLGESGAPVVTMDSLLPKPEFAFDELGLEVPLYSVDHAKEFFARLDSELWDEVRRRLQGGLEINIGGDLIAIPSRRIVELFQVARSSGRPYNAARHDLFAMIVEDLARLLSVRIEEIEAEFDTELAAQLSHDALDSGVDEDLQSLFGVGYDQVDMSAQASAHIEVVRAQWLAVLPSEPALLAMLDDVWPVREASDVLLKVLTAQLDGNANLDNHKSRPVRSSVSERHVRAALDEVRARVDGFGGKRFGHIFVDEAQDLAPIEWHAIRRRVAGASITAAGDVVQSISADMQAWPSESSYYGGLNLQKRTLSVIHRGTEEIARASRCLRERIVGYKVPFQLAVPKGSPVAMERVSAGRFTAAVEMHYLRLGQDACVLLAGESSPELDLVLAKDGSPVRSAMSAKGLEFADVLVVVPDTFDRTDRDHLRQLYVALTRATASATIVTVESALDDLDFVPS